MKDFKTFLREKEQLDEVVPFLLLAPIAMNLFPKLFKGGAKATGALFKGAKALYDLNKKQKLKIKDKQLQKALENFDPSSEESKAQIQKLEDDILKKKDPQGYMDQLKDRAKSASEKLKSDNEEAFAEEAVDKTEKDTEDSEDSLAAASDNEMGDATAKVASSQKKEKAAKDKEAEVKGEEEPEDSEDKEEPEEESSKESKPNDDIEKKISKLKSGIKDASKESKPKYKAWIKYYEKVLDSEDPDSVKKPEGKPPQPKDKKQQVKESYIKAAGFWANK